MIYFSESMSMNLFSFGTMVFADVTALRYDFLNLEMERLFLVDLIDMEGFRG